ncbi:MAG: hypothetical protein MUC96_30790 [Myxococcaceae bacterium]|jgi:tetratricopeptide (TPR) repeat protein|nr:hypothetical protein [Myxococcaceae bacterium]
MLTFLVSVALAASPPVDSPEYKEQLTEAIRRHDGGDYEGAITVYRSMLTTWPHEPRLVYELALSMNAARTRPDEVVAFVEGEFKLMKAPIPELYSLLGSLWDARREVKTGEAWFRKGLAKFPKSAELRFNLGINLAVQGRSNEAEKELLRCAQTEPHRAGLWRTLSILAFQDDRVTDAVLTKMRLVVLDPRSKWGRAGAAEVDELLRRAVSVEDGKVTIRVSNPDDMVFGMVVAASRTKEGLTPGEQFVEAMRMLLEVVSEQPKTPLRRAAVSLFLEAKRAGVLEAALWELRAAANDPEAETWFSTHQSEAEAFEAFLREPRAQARRNSPL